MPYIPTELRAIAVGQHDLVRRSQALELVSEARLRRLLAPGGPAQIVVRGVYAMFTGRLDDTQRRQAALLFGSEVTGADDDVMITGSEACRMHNLRELPPNPDITVLIGHGRRRASSGFVVVERTRRAPRPRELAGFKVAPISRAILDAARRMRELDQVRKLMLEAVQRRRVSIQALDAELRNGPMNWSARPRMVMQELLLGARSLPEGDLVQLLSTSDVLTAAHHNCDLVTPEGEFLGTPDAYLDDVGLALEIQSVTYHVAPEAQEADYDRGIRFAKYGVEMFEIRPTRLTAPSSRVLEDIEAVYELRRAQGIRPTAVVRCRPECPLRRRPQP